VDVREIDLKLSGMSCSSCVATIEGALNKMPGVTANVNFATESAHVIAPENIEIAQLLTAVSGVGYKAELLSASNNQFLETPALGWRLVIAIFFAIPTIAILHSGFDKYSSPN
jgi:Cu+-exporting ATPase